MIWWAALAGATTLVVIIIIFWRYFYFFRDPERSIPDGRNIVSPADGTIVYVKEFKKGMAPIAIKKAKEIDLLEITKSPLPIESGYIVGIYMTLWDVHVNRAPISGTVEDVTYHGAGRNRSMALFGFQTLLLGRPRPRTMGHILENERNVICLKGDFIVYLVQIADFYTNKIVCWVKNGQQIQKGERIGKIMMGSQVDIILPEVKGLRITVKEGGKVKAGQSVIATY